MCTRHGCIEDAGHDVYCFAWLWREISADFCGLTMMQLCSSVHEHALEIVEGQMMQQDALMSQLARELDNGRLLRLLSRLIMVSEGNQTSLEPNWSETGLCA